VLGRYRPVFPSSTNSCFTLKLQTPGKKGVGVGLPPTIEDNPLIGLNVFHQKIDAPLSIQPPDVLLPL